ncbi:MAG: hypothetical protein ACI8XO_004974 [Verrucomicrobiales bacterium]|jgi:hypothetical protein
MKHSEDNDPTWDLLKQARETKPAGNFAQNVMREVRLLDDAQDPAAAGWFSLRWAGAASAVAAVGLGGFMLFWPNSDSPAEQVVEKPSAAPTSYDEEITIEEFTQELDELAYFCSLIEVTDTSLLADEDLAALLF